MQPHSRSSTAPAALGLNTARALSPTPARTPQALLNSSHMYYEADKHFKHYGVSVGSLGYDWGQMQKQKDDAVSGLTKGIEGLFKKYKVWRRGMHALNVG